MLGEQGVYVLLPLLPGRRERQGVELGLGLRRPRAAVRRPVRGKPDPEEGEEERGALVSPQLVDLGDLDPLYFGVLRREPAPVLGSWAGRPSQAGRVAG